MKIRKGNARASFTLLEIMIVIAIIAILISIAVGAYFRVYVLADQLAARSDITQLSAAIEKFKSDHGGKYPPSQIKLAFTLTAANYPQRNQQGTLDYDSVQFLTTVFGSRIVDTWDPTNTTLYPTGGPGIDWTGLTYTSGGTMTGMGPNTPPIILEGDQCLVFFLGGAQSVTVDAAGHHQYSFQGFTNNRHNPMAMSGGSDAYQGALFQFKGNTVQDSQFSADPYRITTALHADGLFPSYVDSYGHQPYAYFSAYNRNNGYNLYGTTDCPTLNVSPYAQAATAYQNPETYQIICAGRDGKFGPGSGVPPSSFWTAGTAGQPGSPTDPGSPGADDMSNFSGILLGFSK